MSTTQERDPGGAERDVSGWAAGGIAFAGTVMVMIGAFQIMEGIVASRTTVSTWSRATTRSIST